MLKFAAEQRVFEIGGVKVGGQPGEYPTVLVGSIFYSGHRIVHDSSRGLFDRAKARALLDEEARLSAMTGNPRIVDVIADTAEALISYISFATEATGSPVLVDSPSQKVRLEAVKHFAGSTVVPRLIYNAIAEDRTDEELDCLKQSGVKSAVLLAFSSKAVRPAARLKLLREELIPAAQRAGIDSILVDTGVLDVPSVAFAGAAIREVKDSLGLPAGCAPANAVYTWKKLRDQGSAAFQAGAAAVFAATQAQGANFIFYGPVGGAAWVYPAVAAGDALLAYSGRLAGIRPAAADHPLYRVF